MGKVEIDQVVLKTAVEAHEKALEQGRLTVAAIDLKRARESKAAADEDRVKKYKPPPDLDGSTQCQYVFEPGGRYPYDKWTGATTPYCSMCHQMVEKARGALAGL